MFSGIIRHLPVTMTGVALLISATVSLGGTAAADPSQDQQFFDLLGQKDVPPVDGENGLITTAHKVCSQLDSGMSVGDLVELIRNNGYNEDPLTRLNPPDRITRTINQFITASVEAYCPYDRGKIASIAAYHPSRPSLPTYQVTAYTHRAAAPSGLVLASLVGPLPAGEIAPTKPIPIPAQPPQVPQEVAPAPQEPPPPPKRVQRVPQPAPPQQAEPAPQEAPPPEAPPPEPPPPAAEPPAQEAPPAAPAPALPGGGNAPASPTPDQPTPPGHIRLAP